MPHSKKLIGLQVLRAFAALMVVFFHCMVQVVERHGTHGPYPKLEFGNAGVDIFFVVSGFIMVVVARSRKSKSVNGAPARVFGFWRDRFVRVVPIYWFWTSLFTLVLIVLASGSGDSVPTWGHLIKSYLFIPEFHTDPKFANFVWPVLIPGWTLNYEIFFYAVFGLCLLFANLAMTVTVFTSVILTLVGFGLWYQPTSAIGQVYTHLLLLEFVAGVAIGVWVTKFKAAGFRVSLAMIVAAIALLAASDVTQLAALHRVLKYGIPAVLLVLGVVGAESLFAKQRFLALLGSASYSIYLTHPFTVAAAGLVWGKLQPELSVFGEILAVVSILGISAGVGVFAYFFLEQPVTRFFRAKPRVGVVAA